MTDLDQMRRARNAEMDRLRRRRNTLAQLNGISTSMVAAAPIRSHLKRLHDLGWSYEALAAMNGNGTAAALSLIARGNSIKAERKFEDITRLPYSLAVPDSVGDNMWVPSRGSSRRVRALLAVGWRHEDMAEFAGRSLHRFAHEGSGKTRAIDWRIIDRMFDRLSTAPGGSTKSIKRAESLGYAPPLAWDNIDDPDEQPVDWQYVAARAPEEVLGEWENFPCDPHRTRTGNIRAFAASLNRPFHTIEKSLYRAGAFADERGEAS